MFIYRSIMIIIDDNIDLSINFNDLSIWMIFDVFTGDARSYKLPIRDPWSDRQRIFWPGDQGHWPQDRWPGGHQNNQVSQQKISAQNFNRKINGTPKCVYLLRNWQLTPLWVPFILLLKALVGGWVSPLMLQY